MTGRQVLSRLRRLSVTIKGQEARLGELRARRELLLAEGRKASPKVPVADLAAAADLSEIAVHKALQRYRQTNGE